MEQQRASKGTKHGFQAQQQGNQRGVRAFLRHDLQGIGNAAGENTQIQNRPHTGPDVRQHRLFQQQGRNGGFHRHHRKLGQRQSDGIGLGGKVVDAENLYRKAQGAEHDIYIAALNPQPLAHAQQIHTHHGDDHADGGEKGRLPPEKQPQQGDQHDVKGGDEAGLAGVGFAQADLLQSGGHGHGCAAAQAAQQQGFFAVFGRLLGASALPFGGNQ